MTATIDVLVEKKKSDYPDLPTDFFPDMLHKPNQFFFFLAFSK